MSEKNFVRISNSEIINFKFVESIDFKLTGTIILYLVSAKAGTMALYNMQIAKLYNPNIFALELIIAGVFYTIIEFILNYFLDNIYKDLASQKSAGKNVAGALILTAVLCILVFVNRRFEIINKYVVKVMFVIITFKVIGLTLFHVKNSVTYNKKLKEVNGK